MSFDALILDQVDMAYDLLGCASVTITRTTDGGYDPATGGTTTTTQTQPAKFKLDGSSLQTLGYKFGADLVQASDVSASIPAKGLDFAPLPGDVLALPAGNHRVISVQPQYAPGGTATEYALLVRK